MLFAAAGVILLERESNMALVNILAFGICLLMLAYVLRESLAECLPVLFCMLILILYVLAILHHLSWIDYLGCIIAVGFAVWLVGCGEEKRKAFGSFCRENMTQTSFIIGLLGFVMIALGVSGKVVTWWDDVNFWLTDVKALYYLDGLAGRYGNAAPSFGDYPPGSQLIKWWFLHLDPGTFREGLAFIGYHTMNMVFMLPMFRALDTKNPIVLSCSAIILWIFPSITEVYGYDGFCADLTMACIYGGFLFGVIDREKHTDTFYYGRLMLYLGVLVLIKSTGFIWAAFGLIFVYGCFYLRGQILQEGKKGLLRGAVFITAAPLVTGASWMGLCILLRRVAKTTSTAVKYVITDEYGLSAYSKEYASAYIQAFVKEPLHKIKGFGLDLTPLACYILIGLLLAFFIYKRLLPPREGKFVLAYSMISGIVYYIIIYISHLTIFAMETQYLEASGMISSIERYGAPFTAGTLLFLACVWMEQGDKLFAKSSWPHFLGKYGKVDCLFLMIALTAQWNVSYHGLIGYREEVPGQLEARADMLDEEARLFLNALEVLDREQSARVFCIQRRRLSWVHNSYTNLEASPVSVVYQNINLEEASADWLAQEIAASHASYLYVEQMEGAEVMLPFLTKNEENFDCGTLYRIAASEDGTLLLEKATGKDTD